jgi:hypothetical protein
VVLLGALAAEARVGRAALPGTPQAAASAQVRAGLGRVARRFAPPLCSPAPQRTRQHTRRVCTDRRGRFTRRLRQRAVAVLKRAARRHRSAEGGRAPGPRRARGRLRGGLRGGERGSDVRRGLEARAAAQRDRRRRRGDGAGARAGKPVARPLRADERPITGLLVANAVRVGE